MQKKLEVTLSDINYNILSKLARQRNVSIEEMADQVFHYGILWATGEKQRRIVIPPTEKASPAGR